MLGQLLLVGGLLAVAATDNILFAASAAFVIFAGNVVSLPAWNAAIMDLAPETHRGTLIGLTVALSGLGLALGPFIGGPITNLYGAPATFRVAAGVCAGVGVAVWLYARTYGAHHVTIEEASPAA